MFYWISWQWFLLWLKLLNGTSYILAMIYCDAHIHIADIGNWMPFQNSSVCACANNEKDYLAIESLGQKFKNLSDFRIIKSFGIHPQLPDKIFISFLQKLLEENRIDAIGEIGFDLYTEAFRSNIELQKDVWRIQLELACFFHVPVVIHSRRAMPFFFQDAAELKKLPSVVFHSFAGSPTEANSFLRKGVDAFFSIGKQVLNGNKNVISCATDIPFSRILAETDAPYQTLKGESSTQKEDIERVYQKIAVLRNMPVEQLCSGMADNFKNAFIN